MHNYAKKNSKWLFLPYFEIFKQIILKKASVSAFFCDFIIEGRRLNWHSADRE